MTMTAARNETLAIRFSRGFDEVAALRSEWESLPSDAITADFDFFHTVLASEPSMLEPAVLTISRGGQPEAMVIARLERVPLSFKLGYLRIYEPEVRTLTVVHRGFRGELDAEKSTLVVRELTRVLDEGEFEAVIFRRLDTQHPLHHAATRQPPLFVRQLYTSVGTCWERSLPESLPAFLKSLSKSTRSSVRNYSNRLEREFGDRLEVRRYTDPSDLDTYLVNADSIAAKTYQRGLGVGVRNDSAERMRTQLAMERGWFRAHVLYIDGSPVAFSAGNAYRGRFYYGIPGYDPAYGNYRVGTYVFLKMVEDLCADDTVDVLDFGPGEAEHKRHFCDRSWYEAEVYLFAPDARPRFINLARAAILRTNDGLASVARTAGVVDKVKRSWRDRARTHRPKK
jgi:hypothetical protein